MGIGTSKGAYYRDEGHYAASQWDDRYDDNVVTPRQMETNKSLEKSGIDNLGLEVRNQMPFPDNRNPDSDFNSRFGTLPPSGIYNDLKKPTGETRPLVRRIGYEEEHGAFGTGSPAEESEQKSGISSIIGMAYEGLGKMAKGAIESSETMRTTGVYNPGPVLEAAALTAGTGATSAISTPVGRELVAGIGSAIGKIGEKAEDFAKWFTGTTDRSVSISADQSRRILSQRSNIAEAQPLTYREIDDAFMRDYMALEERLGVSRFNTDPERYQEFHRGVLALEDHYDNVFRAHGHGRPLRDMRGEQNSYILDDVLHTNNPHPDYQTFEQQRNYLRREQEYERYTDEISESTQDSWKYGWGDVGDLIAKEGNIALHKNKAADNWSKTAGNWVFKTDDAIGTITFTLDKGGKRIYVEGMYGEGGSAMHDFGSKEIKNLLKIFAKQFPEAETIAGHRISGVRGNVGQTGHAEMVLPGRKKADGSRLTMEDVKKRYDEEREAQRTARERRRSATYSADEAFIRQPDFGDMPSP